jgi:cold shock CspA family protein
MTDTIVSIIADRGFGFLRPDGENTDLFFHVNNLRDLAFSEQLIELRVEFEREQSPRGARAVSVRAAGP